MRRERGNGGGRRPQRGSGGPSRGRSQRGGRGDRHSRRHPRQSAESGNQRERIAIESGDLVLIDQFMLANPQFIEKMATVVDEDTTVKNEVIREYGGKVIAVTRGTYRIEREYISLAQGLAGKPDALIEEAGLIIPVERKPLAKKLRDRYIAQLLVYMRLVEEFEGKRPTHGYLLLGPTCKRIRVDNTEAKQRWAQGLIDQMRRILDGGPVTPSPHPIKCAKCDVRQRCYARADVVQDQTASSDKER